MISRTPEQNSITVEPLQKTTEAQQEQTLIAGLKAGDAECFELLVRNYGARVLSTARRYLRSEADAQDCVQESYLKVFQNIDQFEGQSSLATWLHRIVVNTALMTIRSSKRRREDFIEDDSTIFNADGSRQTIETELALSVEELALNNESSALVRNAIDQLPTTARSLILLRDIDGYSTVETSELLDMSLSNVKTGLHRARKLLRKQINNSLMQPAA